MPKTIPDKLVSELLVSQETLIEGRVCLAKPELALNPSKNKNYLR
jgi:hypothetical protein